MAPAGSPPVAEHADVLVIGAGASGGVAARRFAEAGMRVVCLEQGDWPDRTTYPGAAIDAELRIARGPWSSVPSVRANAADYPLDLTASDMGVVNFNGVGGGTVLYNAQWPRLLPHDFRVRSLFGVADDWPLDYDELRPWYEATDRQFGVSGLGGNTAYPPGEDPPLPPLPIGAGARRVARAHAALGWHWWPEPNAILSADHDGRHRCVQRGTCGSGCNEGAKASTDLTHWPHVVARGGRVVTGARVTRLVLDRAGRALGAEWVDRDGATHLQTADVTVLAANAIGTARLLLASACEGHRDGVANRSGLVGRRLMLHPLLSVAGLFDEPLRGWHAHAGGLIQSLQFSRSDPARGYIGSTKWALSTAGGPMRALFSPPATSGVWGDGHHRHIAERLGRTVSWIVLVEDLPDEANRVELSSDLVDGDGLAAPRIVYRIDDNTRRNMAFQAARADESLRAAGAWRTDTFTHPANGHFMGTARMGDDPSTSVVDRWCTAHDVPNLVVVDGSVFVTAGAGNPTSTIAALALRAADHLVDRRRDMPTPGRPVSFAVPSTPVTMRRREPAAVAPDRPAPLPPAVVDRIATLADVLIPATATLPGGAGPARGGIGRVLDARPDLRGPLLDALDALPADATIDDITAEDRNLHALRYAIAGAYYTTPSVHDALGFTGGQPRPVPTFDYPDYLAEGLLDHLL
jgi:choline dehydrogenase-like flavoprotein